MDSEKKLILLGFCAGSIPVITEIADELEGITTFDIIKNIDVDETGRPFKFPGYTIQIFKDEVYDRRNFENNPVQLGVLNSHIKFILFEYFSKSSGIKKDMFISLIHPSCFTSKSSEIGPGCLIEPLCNISSFTEIGFGVTLKRGSSLGHHSKMGDFSNLNPGVTVSGNVSIGEGTEIGTGACVVNNISIGRHCLIGAGSVVTKDIPDGVVAYGNPCKIIRTNERLEKVKQLTGNYKITPAVKENKA